MSLSKFKFLFAYRNVSANKKSSSIVILTLSLVFCLLILLLSMNSTFSKIYELDATNKYQNIDIVMTYDEYSSARLINKRKVQEEVGDYLDYSLSFFNLNLLTESGEEKYYTQMMSSLPHEFEILVDQDVLIQSGSAIITETYAEEHNLSIGDTFKFYILENEFIYIVGDIFPDTGLFSHLTFYVDKDEIMNELYGTTILSNFGNTLYLSVGDGYEIEDTLEMLKANDDFSGYYTFPTVNWDYISNRAMDLSSMMLALGLIVLLATVMVLDSLFPIVNRDVRHQQGIVNTLGGEESLVWHVNLLQWIIFIIISFVLGVVLSTIVVNYGIYIYGIDGFILIKPIPILLALGLVTLFIIIRAYIAYSQSNQLSVINLSKNKRYKLYKTRYPYIVVAAIVLFVEWKFVFFSLGIHSLIIVLLSLYLALNISSIILILLANLFKKLKKNSVFRIFQIKYLKTNKHIHQSMRVLFISLISLVLIFSVRAFMFQELTSVDDSMNFDLAIVNIHDYDENLLAEVETYDVVEADEVVFYYDTVIHFNEEDFQSSKFFVSMEYSKFDTYFDFQEPVIDNIYISAEIPYVVIPKDFGIVYDLEKGDIVNLNLNYLLEDVDMVIAGFFDSNFDNIIYSNIYELDLYTETAKPNSIFVKSNNPDLLFDEFVRDYSSKMYYVLDPEIDFDRYTSGVENIVDYFTIFTSFMILCFIIVIFNNTILIFYGLKSDLAKIKILGGDRYIFIKTLLQEFLLILSIVLVIGIVELNILSIYLKNVVLLTNFYKDISATYLTNLYGCVIVSCVLFTSYLYYFYNINKIKIIKEIQI
ncbi:hypothetical protein RJI07_04355 [Mycoplasmatota bacterium WC30]